LRRGPYVLKIRGKIAREYGGPEALTPVIKERCLACFREWARIAAVVIAAEYPDFDLVEAFQVFKLRQDSRYQSDDKDKWFHESCIARLTKVFGGPEDTLKRELGQLIGLGRQIQMRESCNPKVALRNAWKIMRRKGRGAVVEQPLWRNLAWHTATSANERDFALERRVMLHKSSSKTHTRFRILRLGSTPPEKYSAAALLKLVGRARELWVQQHPTGTKERTTPVDARIGQKCVHKFGSKSMTVSWKKRRNAAIDEAVASRPTTSIKIKGLPEYTPRADSSADDRAAAMGEVAFNHTKYHQRMVEAEMLGTLIDSERHNNDMMDDIHAETAQQRKVDQARMTAEKNMRVRIDGGHVQTPAQLLLKAIYISSNVGTGDTVALKGK